MAFEHLLVDIQGLIARVTVNRPKALNALNSQVLCELGDVCAMLEGREDVRAVVLTGSGEKAFVAGADIAEMKGMTVLEARAFSELGQGVFAKMGLSRLPWIAAVNGFALGGGCELALACDVILASDGARFGQPEVKLGVVPGFGGTQRLLRRVGPGKAMELVLGGEMVGAAEALRTGLVDQMWPVAELLGKAHALAESMATKAPLAVAEAKRLIRRGQSTTLEQGIALEAFAFAGLFSTQDLKEGMTAFIDKRAAVFEGR